MAARWRIIKGNRSRQTIGVQSFPKVGTVAASAGVEATPHFAPT